jgi:hypothetical protein
MVDRADRRLVRADAGRESRQEAGERRQEGGREKEFLKEKEGS